MHLGKDEHISDAYKRIFFKIVTVRILRIGQNSTVLFFETQCRIAIKALQASVLYSARNQSSLSWAL